MGTRQEMDDQNIQITHRLLPFFSAFCLVLWPGLDSPKEIWVLK